MNVTMPLWNSIRFLVKKDDQDDMIQLYKCCLNYRNLSWNASRQSPQTRTEVLLPPFTSPNMFSMGHTDSLKLHITEWAAQTNPLALSQRHLWELSLLFYPQFLSSILLSMAFSLNVCQRLQPSYFWLQRKNWHNLKPLSIAYQAYFWVVLALAVFVHPQDLHLIFIQLIRRCRYFSIGHVSTKCENGKLDSSHNNDIINLQPMTDR